MRYFCILYLMIAGIFLQNAQAEEAAYYEALRNQCEQDALKHDLHLHLHEVPYDKKCCLTSADSMEAQKGILNERQDCLQGYVPQTLRCSTSYHWCEPEGQCFSIDEKTKECISVMLTHPDCPKGFTLDSRMNANLYSCMAESHCKGYNAHGHCLQSGINFYDTLADKCKGDKCCLISVRGLQDHKGLLKNPDGSCQKGYVPDKTCPSSLLCIIAQKK